MQLERIKLIKEIEKFKEKYIKNEIPSLHLELYNEVLSNIENILLKYECEEDSRFVTFGRRDFLREEFSKIINNEINTTDYLFEAFCDIADYIYNDTWISMASVPSEYDFQKIIRLNDEYKEDGIVCKQEKEILLDMICELKNKINNN